MSTTVLQTLGLHHDRLAYRSGGRDFRLTNAQVTVVTDVLARTPRADVRSTLHGECWGPSSFQNADTRNAATHRPEDADQSIPGRIRTSNLWLRRPALYPIELRGRRDCLCGGILTVVHGLYNATQTLNPATTEHLGCVPPQGSGWIEIRV